jgi:hypothetical protein
MRPWLDPEEHQLATPLMDSTNPRMIRGPQAFERADRIKTLVPVVAEAYREVPARAVPPRPSIQR